MFKLEIRRPKSKRSAIKVYAKVQRTEHSEEHLVVYIRTAGMKRWICDCEDFMLKKMSRRRSCVHIRPVREEVRHMNAANNYVKLLASGGGN